MKRIVGARSAAIVLCAGLITAGCAAPGPSAPSQAAGTAAAPPRCEAGTLAIEARAITRQVRKKLAIPDDVKGAVVVQVLPDSPGAAADIRPGDVVQEIGAARIGNACDFEDGAFNRTCEPVHVLLWRAGAAVEVKLVPREQEPYFGRLCRDGISGGCFRQAQTLWHRNREGDRDKALDLYQNACVAGSAEACAEEGARLFREKADRAKDAVAMLQRSCDLGSGAGCTHLAFLYATGSGNLVTKDDRRATPLYVRGCDLSDALGCYNAGLMSDEGRGVARDLTRAAARYDEACEMGSAAACTNLGFLYENGRGVGKDRERAAALYRRGCDGTSCQHSNLNGCVNLGRAYRDGIGVAKDEAKAASLFREACDRKLDSEDVNPQEKISRACSLLGALYLSGDGVERDLAKGRELSELGCERGDSFGCFNAAAVFAAGTGVEKDAAKAAAFLDKACTAGDSEGCYDLGVAYEKGTGVAPDRRRAAELFRKACGLGFEQACARKGKSR